MVFGLAFDGYRAGVAAAATLSLTYMFAVIDRFIARRGFHKPYYATHVIHNAAIVAATLPDIWTTLTQFHALPPDMNWTAICLCYALHFYHTVLYWREFHFDDWLHHVTMIGVALPLGCSVAAGPLLGFSLFFTTGLPGGIVYGMLFAERNGLVDKRTSRRWCAAMNLWVRSPGCCAQAALTWVSVLSAPPTVDAWPFVVALITGALNMWNGQYFLNEVLRAAARVEETGA